jgi:RNA polymerase sigma factor (sigma-70 family)
VTIQDNDILNLYRESFPDVARIVHRMGGTQEDAKDIFHDAFLVFLERKNAGVLSIYSSPQAYIVGTAKIMWLHKSRQISIAELPDEVAEFIEEETREDEKSILSYLQLAGHKCLQLLHSFYYDNMTMQELASRFGFSGARSATVQKFKCLEKIRKQINKTETYAK